MAESPTSTTTTTGAPPAPSLADFQAGLEQVFAAKAADPHADPDAAPEPEAPSSPEDTTAAPSPTAPAQPKPSASKSPVAELPTRGPKAAQWKEVNEDRERLRSRVAELETSLKGYQDKEVDFGQVEPLKKKVAEYDKILREVAAERHPDLIGPIQAKMNQAVDLVKRAISDQAQQAEVMQLLQQPPSEQRDTALEKILEDLPQLRRGRLEKAMLTMEEALGERATLASRSAEAIAQRQQAEQQRRQSVLQEFDAELKDWTGDEKGLDLLRSIVGNAEHNARAKTIAETARSLYSGNVQKPRDVARAALWASVAPYLVEHNTALMGEVEKLNSEINKLKGVSPGLGGSSATAPAGDAADNGELPTGESLSERLVKGYLRLGGSIGQ